MNYHHGCETRNDTNDGQGCPVPTGQGDLGLVTNAEETVCGDGPMNAGDFASRQMLIVHVEVLLSMLSLCQVPTVRKRNRRRNMGRVPLCLYPQISGASVASSCPYSSTLQPTTRLLHCKTMTNHTHFFYGLLIHAWK